MVQPRTLRGHTHDALCGGYRLSVDSSWPLGRAATAGCSLCLTKERMFLLIDCSKELDRSESPKESWTAVEGFSSFLGPQSPPCHRHY